MNKTLLKGRLTKDPEIRYTNEGATIATINIATDRWNSKEKKNDADFHRCTAFGKTAETIEKYFHKGSEILIEGSNKSGSYEKDGSKVYTYDVWVERVEFCGARDNNNAGYSAEIPAGIDEEVSFA